MPVQRHADTIPHHTVQRTDLHGTVQIGPACLDIFRDLGLIAAQVDHHTIDRQNTLDALGIGDFDVFTQMAVFAVHRDQHLWLDHIMQRLKVGTVGMARHVVFPRAVINHIDTHFRELVDDANDALFIAGNGLG